MSCNEKICLQFQADEVCKMQNRINLKKILKRNDLKKEK